MTTQTTLAELATKHPAASRVFHRHGLYFCCHGNRALDEACGERGLVPSSMLEEIKSEERICGELPSWETKPLSNIITYIVSYYHARLREELPLLIQMAERVEKVHGAKASCPDGLADHLKFMHAAVLEHLSKEEVVLFPLI